MFALEMSFLARALAFPDDARGQVLAVLTVMSVTVSSVSSSLMKELSSFAFLPPISLIWFFTVTYHLIIWRQLVKLNRNTAVPPTASTPAGPTPQCLKHGANIAVLLLLSLYWISGSAAVVALAITRKTSNHLHWISGGLAFIEGALLLSILFICRRALLIEVYAVQVAEQAYTR